MVSLCITTSLLKVLCTFGSLTKINVVTSGTGYDAQNKPNLIIEGGGGTGATGEVVVNGSLSDIVLTNGGTGYTVPSFLLLVVEEKVLLQLLLSQTVQLLKF